MAEKYGMLPTQILEQGTTVDLYIFNIVSILKMRADKKARGENITDTYNQEELENMYNKFKNG